MRAEIIGKAILSKSNKIDFFIKYIMSAYYVPDKVLAGGNMAENRTERGGIRYITQTNKQTKFKYAQLMIVLYKLNKIP